MTRKSKEPLIALASPALTTVTRALGLCDRNPESKTFGCADRYYWHYKLIDVPNARFQEAGLLFALAWKTPLVENRFFSKEAMLDWSRACWNFWLNRRNGDGSTNEVYPFERSFCATSFTAACFAETVLLTGGADSWQREVNSAMDSFDWLAEHRNLEVGNQMAASVWALSAFAKVTGDTSFRKKAQQRLSQVVELTTREGVLPEYGGFDSGYQTVSLSALCRARKHFGASEELDHCISLLEGRLRYGNEPDGSVRPEKNSRRTGYSYPYGLYVTASPVFKQLCQGVIEDCVVSPLWMDDRYCIALAVDYLSVVQEICHADDYR